MILDLPLLFSRFSHLDTAIVITLTISFLVVMVYYIFSFLKVSISKIEKKQVSNDNENMPISVVVIVRDDIDFLSTRVHSLFSQSYEGEYQVIIVNFKSQDEKTQHLLNELKISYPDLYITSVSHTSNYQHTLKLAYTLGVKGAQHDHIIFLSSHVSVKSKKWLKECSKGFMRSDMITGYSRISVRKGLANRLVRSHNIINSLLYLGKANSGSPYIANENFFGFTRTLFYKCKGFSSHLRLNRGENDLFIQQAAKYSKLTTLIDRCSSVSVEASDTYIEHIGNIAFATYAQRYYKIVHKLYTFSLHLFTTLFYISAALALILLPTIFKIATLSILGVQFILLTVIFVTLSVRTKEKLPYLTLFFYQFGMSLEALAVWIKQRVRPSKNLWI